MSEICNILTLARTSDRIRDYAMTQFISIVLLRAHIIWQTSMAFKADLKYCQFNNAASEHIHFAVNKYRAHQMLLSPVIPLRGIYYLHQ